MKPAYRDSFILRFLEGKSENLTNLIKFIKKIKIHIDKIKAWDYNLKQNRGSPGKGETTMEEQKFHAPSKCPVCGQTMEVTRLKCGNCGTELNGSFAPCRFCALEEKHLRFVETFLRCRGSIKEVEKALGVSYPTVKNMLDAALNALGLDEKPELRKLREQEEKEEILSRLSNREIDVDTAIEALNQLKGGK